MTLRDVSVPSPSLRSGDGQLGSHQSARDVRTWRVRLGGPPSDRTALPIRSVLNGVSTCHTTAEGYLGY